MPRGALQTACCALHSDTSAGTSHQEDLAPLACPYYLRSVQEIEVAAAEAPDLELLEVTPFVVDFLDGDVLRTKEQLEQVTGMFWAIHQPTLERQLMDRKVSSKQELRGVMDRLKDIYSARFWEMHSEGRVGATMTLVWMRRSTTGHEGR